MSDIHLKYGNTTAAISMMGAQITSFKSGDGREVIWQADPAVWADHTPILFPVIGNCKDGAVIIDGQAYPMTKHGFARKAMFRPASVGENYAILELTETPETLNMYPFAFKLEVSYELTGRGFRCQFSVENRSDRPMPFCVGGHPAFVVPMENEAAFEDYQVIFPEDETVTNLLCPGGQLINGSETLHFDGGMMNLSHAIFDEKDTLLLPELASRSVNLVHKDSGHGLRFSWQGMEALAIWSRPLNHGNYLCLEPWHGLPGMVDESGVFAEKRYATELPPGETYTCRYDVELI